MKRFLQRWLVNTVGVIVAAHMVSGIHYDSFAGLLVASLLLGILNAFLRPLLILFSLPLVLVSLGLFILLINAGLIYLLGILVTPFHVDSFGAAFWGGLIISLSSWFANHFIGLGRNPSDTPPQPPAGRSNPPPGQGPIIDI
jgi:putative membrane protein